MREFVIDEKNKGIKLFRYIQTILSGLKNNEIFKLIRKKIILVNDKKISNNYELKKDDVVKIYLADKHFESKSKNTKFYSVQKKLDIVFEDDNVLVVNKQAGIIVHPDKNEYKNNIYEMVRGYLYNKGEYLPTDSFTPAPCHRLDKNTSGLVVIAKNHTTLKNITEQLRNRKVQKKYKALVLGRIDKKVLLVSLIQANEDKVISTDLKVIFDIPDKNTFLQNNPALSATLVSPIKINNEVALVDIDLWTGKKHQIRVHLASYNHPLVGDKKYKTQESSRFSKNNNFNKYYLHSYKLKLEGFDEWNATLPIEFQKIINANFN